MKTYHYLASLAAILLVTGCSSLTEPTIKGVDATHAGVIIHVVDDASGKPVGSSPLIPLIFIKDGGSDYYRSSDDRDGTETFLLSRGGRHFVFLSMTGYYAKRDSIDVQLGHGTEITERVKKFPPTGPPNFADSLIACYKFSGNAVDSSGNKHDGALTGCEFLTDRFGHSNSALKLKTVHDFVSVKDAPDLKFGLSQSFTIVFWEKLDMTDQLTYGPNSYIVSKGLGTGYNSGFAAAGGNCGFGAYVRTPNGQCKGCGDYGSRDGKWRFHALTFDRTSPVRSYTCDGSIHYQFGWCDDLTWDSMSSDSPLFIGGTGDGMSAFMGAIDDVRIYRGLLTEDYLLSLYHEGGW